MSFDLLFLFIIFEESSLLLLACMINCKQIRWLLLFLVFLSQVETSDRARLKIALAMNNGVQGMAGSVYCMYCVLALLCLLFSMCVWSSLCMNVLVWGNVQLTK